MTKDIDLTAIRALCEAATPDGLYVACRTIVPQMLAEIERLRAGLLAACGYMELCADTVAELCVPDPEGQRIVRTRITELRKLAGEP